MAQNLLTSLSTLKTNYLFDQNLDDKFLISNIIKIQDFTIIPIITEITYNELVSGITQNNLTNEQKTLLNYIEPVIAWYLMSEVSWATVYKMKNRGIETGDMTRIDELIKLSQKYGKDGDHYCELLINYYNSLDKKHDVELMDNLKVGITLTDNYAYKRRYVYKTDLFRRW